MQRRIVGDAIFSWFLISSLFLIMIVASALAQAQATPPAVNPHASPEARALLKMLGSISGQYTVTGQHNYPNHVSRWSDRIYDLTGKYPGLFGQDFGFSGDDDKDSIEGRPSMIEEAKRQYRNGAGSLLARGAFRRPRDHRRWSRAGGRHQPS